MIDVNELKFTLFIYDPLYDGFVMHIEHENTPIGSVFLSAYDAQRQSPEPTIHITINGKHIRRRLKPGTIIHDEINIPALSEEIKSILDEIES